MGRMREWSGLEVGNYRIWVTKLALVARETSKQMVCYLAMRKPRIAALKARGSLVTRRRGLG
jgi:hypothetical protein